MARRIEERWIHHARMAGMTNAEIANYAPAFEHEEMKNAVQFPITPTDCVLDGDAR
jgi:hypothetical protein